MPQIFKHVELFKNFSCLSVVIQSQSGKQFTISKICSCWGDTSTTVSYSPSELCEQFSLPVRRAFRFPTSTLVCTWGVRPSEGSAEAEMLTAEGAARGTAWGLVCKHCVQFKKQPHLLWKETVTRGVSTEKHSVQSKGEKEMNTFPETIYLIQDFFFKTLFLK